MANSDYIACVYYDSLHNIIFFSNLFLYNAIIKKENRQFYYNIYDNPINSKSSSTDDLKILWREAKMLIEKDLNNHIPVLILKPNIFATTILGFNCNAILVHNNIKHSPYKDIYYYRDIKLL
jgi:hypothetical protein